MGMQELVESAEGGQLIVVGEYHGNPGELSFHDENGKLLFSVRFSESYSKDLESYWFPELEPVLTGKGEIAEALEEFFHFERVEEDKIEQLPVRSILIAVGEKEIDFKGDGKSLFKLNLRGFKRY
jgi:U3 small nucleolar ribonucleoprotein protein IMP4